MLCVCVFCFVVPPRVSVRALYCLSVAACVVCSVLSVCCVGF